MNKDKLIVRLERLIVRLERLGLFLFGVVIGMAVILIGELLN